jgi:chorismate mutase
MVGYSDKESRTSSASTLEDRPFKDKHHEDGDVTHSEDQASVLPTEVDDEEQRAQVLRRMRQNAINAMLENPLAGKLRESVIRDAKRFAREHGMAEDEQDFVKGALVARDPDNFENIPELSEEDKAALRFEITHKWRQPFTLYF